MSALLLLLEPMNDDHMIWIDNSTPALKPQPDFTPAFVVLKAVKVVKCALLCTCCEKGLKSHEIALLQKNTL